MCVCVCVNNTVIVAEIVCCLSQSKQYHNWNLLRVVFMCLVDQYFVQCDYLNVRYWKLHAKPTVLWLNNNPIDYGIDNKTLNIYCFFISICSFIVFFLRIT